MRRASILIVAMAVLGAGDRLVIQEERGNRAYRDGRYAESIERYRSALAEDTEAPRLHYNLGTAYLEVGDLEDARAELEQALEAQDAELRFRAFYNLGNAHARLGSGQPRNRDALRSAVQAYRRALLLEPGSQRAKWNLEVALRRLDRLDEETPPTPPSQQPQSGDGSGGGEQPDDGANPEAPGVPETNVPPEGRRDPGELPDLGPLPPELARGLLRAVEERERGLQKEKLRERHPNRRRGPDW